MTMTQPQLTRLMDVVKTHIETKQPLLLFINRTGDIDSVTVPTTERDEYGDEVMIELATRAGRPHFEICTVIDGAASAIGNFISLDNLPTGLAEAVANAEAERVRFYSERAEEYGEDAWPKAAATGSNQ
jgi:hypothetical protein